MVATGFDIDSLTQTPVDTVVYVHEGGEMEYDPYDPYGSDYSRYILRDRSPPPMHRESVLLVWMSWVFEEIPFE